MRLSSVVNYRYPNYSKTNTGKKSPQSISFQGVVTETKMKKFVPQLGSFLFNTPEINLKEIEAFLKKFRPNLKVNLVPINSILGKAQAKSLMGLDLMLNPYIIDEEIGLTDFKADNFENKIELFEQLVHEMTHIFQADLDNEEEAVNLVNIKYAKEKIIQNPSNETIEFIKENSNKLQKIFHELEFAMISALQSQGYRGEVIYKPANDIDMLDVESAYYKAFGKTSRAFMRDFVKEKIKEYKVTDPKFVEKIIKTQANCEYEAYSISQEAVKDILGIKGTSSNDYMKYIFKIISNIDLEV